MGTSKPENMKRKVPRRKKIGAIVFFPVSRLRNPWIRAPIRRQIQGDLNRLATKNTIAPNFHLRWSLRFIFPGFEVPMAPTSWPNMSAKLQRSSEFQRHLHFSKINHFPSREMVRETVRETVGKWSISGREMVRKRRANGRGYERGSSQATAERRSVIKTVKHTRGCALVCFLG